MLADVFTVRAMLAEKKQQKLLQVSPDTSVIIALDTMREAKVGALLVMEGEHFAGIFTERDYAWKVELETKTAARTTVAEIMTPAEKVVSCSQFTTLEEALIRMDDHHIRHLPVIEDGKVLGMISIRDVMHGITRHQIFLAQQFSGSTGGRT